MSDEIPANVPSSLEAAAAALVAGSGGGVEGQGRSWRERVFDHNPCLMLSMVFMLLGCVLVNSALREADQGIKRMGLLLVMNVYEACIIPLGLVLLARTGRSRAGAGRDGMWLIIFEMLFLVNATFVNVDFGPAGWRWSLPFNVGVFVWACVKAGVVFRGMGLSLGMRTFGFFVVQLAVVYGLPILFSLTEVDGAVPAMVMYGCWWVVGILPLGYDLIARFGKGEGRWEGVQQIVRRVYLVGPWVMLVAHVGFSHWAHQSGFVMADVGPVLLGVAIASRRVELGAAKRVVVRMLPVVAVVLTWMGMGEMAWHVALPGDVRPHVLTAMHAIVPAAVLAYGYLGTAMQCLGSVLAVGFSAVGFVMQNWILEGTRRAVRAGAENVPTSVMGWGEVAIGAAFVLLGVGAVMGLRGVYKTRGEAG